MSIWPLSLSYLPPSQKHLCLPWFMVLPLVARMCIAEHSGGMSANFSDDIRAVLAGITSKPDVMITCSGAAVAATYTSPNLSAKIACSPSLVKVAALTFLGHFLQGAAR